MVKRLIFDIDGTIIDGGNFRDTITKVLKRLNAYSEENLEKYLEATRTYEDHYDNYNRKDYTDYFSKCVGVELGKEYIDILFDELQYCIPEDNTKIREKIEELSKHYEIVILTNYFEEGQRGRLKNMGINDYFSECFGEKIIKDNKEAFLSACGNHLPEECVMIGDNPVLDIKGADRCGLKTIWINKANKEIDIDTFQIDSVKNITVDMIEKL